MLQIVRDWVLKLNERGPDGLVGGKAPGPRLLLEDRHRAALMKAVEDGPIPAVRWRVIDMCQWVRDEFSLTVSKHTLARELRALGYRKLSARPRHHAQAAEAVEAFRKSPRVPGRDRARTRCRPRRRRGLVRRRGQGRAEEQHYPALGEVCQRFRPA